ncbi:MAG: undecaprenyl-diphosphate phosphatase [Candidatus Bathyarchaeota archaeon]|nr:undecaprenyl-diphosphate phosphatase [Candidatus Bathyarchaeota archaeon]
MIVQLLQVLLLGLIQGISEWLPISSTAHLKLAGEFLGLTVTPFFNIILHMGTLTVLLFFFRREIKGILVALAHLDFKSENGMLIPRIIVATIPTAVIGVTYSQYLQDSLGTIPIIAATFLIGGTFVYSTKFAQEKQDTLPYKTALIMGIAQGFAIFPGLSRSGITISTALLLGLKRPKAFKFSFLLSIPAIVGDFVVEAYSEWNLFSVSGLSGITIFAGVATAAVVGYFALKLLSRIVRGRKFYYFAFYTWTLGIVLLVWTFLTQ